MIDGRLISCSRIGRRLAARRASVYLIAVLVIGAPGAAGQIALPADPFEPEPLQIAERAVVSYDADLRLGTLIAGQPGHTVSISDPDAAIFRIAATPGRELRIRFELLPSALEHRGSRVGVVESGWVAGWSFSPEPRTAATFDPRSGFGVRFSSPDQILYVWLGAQLAAVDARQPSGEYTATATLRIE